MEQILQWLIQNAPGMVLGALFAIGLPMLVKILRRDAHKKLTDKDPKNDFVGNIEKDLADIIERKQLEKENEKKVLSKK